MNKNSLESATSFTPNRNRKTLSRRDFLKLSGAALLAWLPECSPKPTPEPTRPEKKKEPSTPTPIPPKKKELDENLTKMNTEMSTPTKEQIDFIKNQGRNPVEMILERLKGDTRLVGLGEMHGELDIETFANNVIAQAAEQGLIGFLALEIDDDRQEDIDRFLETGKMNEDVQDVLRRHNEGYYKMLETVRKHHLPVLCVDNSNLSWRRGEYRGDYMSRKILSYMEQHPHQKGLCYVGNGHVIKRKNILAEELGNNYYSAITINHGSELYDAVYLAALRAGITEPVGIDNVSSTPFSGLTYGHPHESWSEYGRITDSLIILP